MRFIQSVFVILCSGLSACTLPPFPGEETSEENVSSQALTLLGVINNSPSGSEGATPTCADNGCSTYFIGHSQVSHSMPSYFQWIGEASGHGEQQTGRQMIWGSNLNTGYHMHDYTGTARDFTRDPGDAGGNALHGPYDMSRYPTKGGDSHVDLATGDYDVLVMTEEHDMIRAQARREGWVTAAPTSGDNWFYINYARTWEDRSGGDFYRLAASANPRARVFLYANYFEWAPDAYYSSNTPPVTLAHLNAWRAEIHEYRAVWEGMAGRMNDRIGQDLPAGAPVRVIHAASALSYLVGQICAGNVAGMVDPLPLFDDYVHMTDTGRLFIALVHYTAIYGRSAEGVALAGSRTALSGDSLTTVADSTVQAFARIAREVVLENAYAAPATMASCGGL